VRRTLRSPRRTFASSSTNRIRFNLLAASSIALNDVRTCQGSMMWGRFARHHARASRSFQASCRRLA
jgi:hypothetical protein